jgi:hypothetical protein
LAHINDHFTVNQDALTEWEQAPPDRHVPEPLLRTTIAPTDPEVAALLHRVFMHDRTGNAAVRQRAGDAAGPADEVAPADAD